MRTRRSPRNQERLWRILTPPVPPVVATSSVRCWDCLDYPPGGRGRGHCTLGGMMVNGRTENRPCFRARRTEGTRP